MIPIPPLATIRKLAVYIVAIGAVIPASITLPSPWDVLVPLIIAIAGAVAHYNIPNAPVLTPVPPGNYSIGPTATVSVPLPVPSPGVAEVAKS